MCFVLYLGTDTQLATSDFSPEAPAFYVGTVGGFFVGDANVETLVRQHLTLPNVYHLGAHTSCGCGYGYGQDPAFYTWAAEFPDEAAIDPQEAVSRRQLADLLHQLVGSGHAVEVLADWSGFEGEPPERRLTLTPDAFLDPACITEGDLVRVTTAPPS